MKFLLDTNVFIPLEPSSTRDRESLSATAMSVYRLVLENRHQLFLHPASKVDIARDKDSERRAFRELHVEKYPMLPHAPVINTELEKVLGYVDPTSHDWVDHHLIASLWVDSVDFLITEDRKLSKKARRLGLEKRVLLLSEAQNLILDLSDNVSQPPRPIEAVLAYRIDANDPILDSLRGDYPGFDDWFKKCKREHRKTWIIPGTGSFIAGFCLINPENEALKSMRGKVLKICTFKISSEYNGFRYGELLLKAVLEHAFENNYDWIFVTTYEKQDRLMELFEDFGFERDQSQTNLGETILTKPLKVPGGDHHFEPLPFHIRFGPKHFLIDVPWFVVPIQPRFADILFPETPHQVPLPFEVGAYASGNAVKKAYLCHSPIKSIVPGSGLVFYRSIANRGAMAIGIVEDSFQTKLPEEIVRAVGKRTVYSLREITAMCQKPVRVILFRQARAYFPEMPLAQLLEGGVFKASPQSIISVKGENLSWIKNNLIG